MHTGGAGPESTPGPENRSYLVADSGVLLAGLARWAMKHGWAGLEWAISIPGTVGGAVIGNAGAHGGDMASNVAWVEVTHPRQGRQMLALDELGVHYRSSRLKDAIGDRERASWWVGAKISSGAARRLSS